MDYDYGTADVARQIADYVNGMAGQGKEFAQSMSTHHRTLQQGFTRLCVAWFEHLATLDDGQYDLRNEASVKLAKQIVASPAWEKVKYLPHL